MKRNILFILLAISTASMAVTYGVTHKPKNDVTPISVYDNKTLQTHQIGRYSTIATGGTTTTGEGSVLYDEDFVGPMRNTTYGGDQPTSPQDGDVWVDANGVTWIYNSSTVTWTIEEEDTKLDTAGNPLPIGEPLILLLFAGIYLLRQRKLKNRELGN